MEVDAEAAAAKAEKAVDRHEAEAERAPFLRVREDEQPLGQVGGGPDERIGVRVAADDAVHDDDVVPRDVRAAPDEVADATLDAVGHPSFGGECGSGFLVAARELDVRRPLGAARQQLQPDCADAAADVEDARIAGVPGELDDLARAAAQAVRAIPPCVALGGALTEHPPVVARTAAGPGLSL